MLSLVLVFQIATTLILCEIVVGKVNYSSFTLKEFSNISKEQGVYFCPDYPLSQIDLNSLLSNVKNIDTVERTGFYSEDYIYPVKIYSSGLVNILSPKLNGGTWLNNVVYKQGTIHAVCSRKVNGINIGSIFTGQLANDDSSKQISIAIEIVGFLSSPNIPLDFGIGGNKIKISDLLIPDSAPNQLPTLLISQSELNNYNSKTGDISNYLITFNSQVELDKNINSLKNFGMVNTISSIVNNEKAEISKQLKVFIPYLIIISLMILVGIIGLTLLSIYQNLKEFAIYYMVGCSTSLCLRICLNYVFLIIGTASIISIPILMWIFSPSNIIAMQITSNIINVIVFFILWMIIISASILELRIVFKNFGIAQIIRTNN